MTRNQEKSLYDRIEGLEMELNAIMKCSRDGIAIVNADGRFIKWNKRFEEIYQLTSNDVTSGKELVTRGIYQQSSSRKALTEHRMVTVLNHTKWGKEVMSTSIPIIDHNEKIIGAVVNTRDLTEIKALEAKLNEADQALKRSEYQVNELRKEQIISQRFLYQSVKMKNLVELTKKVCDLDTGLLIIGETGVGKSFFAEIIHQAGSRREQPFVAVNCASIPESLLESELFGYEKGAFTGANSKGKLGMFELANGGTLFLDEIAEIPLALQAKLLYAIERREITRVGGKSSIPLDIRIIVATNQDLKEMVAKGLFRKDLYFRLDIIKLVIPPLREREDDLVLLANEFLNNFCKKYNRQCQLSPGTSNELLKYHWPGNVRELQNFILRLVLTTTDSTITVDDVQKQLTINSPSKVPANEIIPLKEAVQQLENELVGKAMKIYGSTREAAKALGISQSTVVRKNQKRIRDEAKPNR